MPYGANATILGNLEHATTQLGKLGDKVKLAVAKVWECLDFTTRTLSSVGG